MSNQNVTSINSTSEYVAEEQQVSRKALFELDHADYLSDAAMTSQYVERSEMTPEVSGYVFDAKEVTQAEIAVALDEPLMITGGTGSGKTDFVRAYADKKNSDLTIISCNEEMSYGEIFGRDGLKTVTNPDGSTSTVTYWEDGTLAKAIRKDNRPQIILFDEIDHVPASLAKTLNHFIATGELWVHGKSGDVKDSKIVAHSGTRIFATTNTGGRVDYSGSYQNNGGLDASTIDRFVYMEKHYAEEETEKSILTDSVVGLDDSIVEGLLKYANLTRASHMGENGGEAIDRPLSTRKLIKIAKYVLAASHTPSEITGDGGALRFAIDTVYINGLDVEDKGIAIALYETVFGTAA